MILRIASGCVATLLLTGAAVSMARAQTAADYPSGAVKLVVPFAAGGPTDVVARILAEQLSARWGGKAVLIENRPGAGTIVASSVVAKAQPDGLTLLVATNSLLINPAINKQLPYDTAKEFAPVTMIAVQPVALVANKDYVGRSVADIVAQAKREPMNYTSPGPRGVGDLAGQMLKQRAGIPDGNFTHINYNGSAPALTDVIAGRVPVMFDIWHSARRYVESGELKLIAGASAERLPDKPDVPTINEAYPGVEVIAFNAIMATGGTPQPIVDKLAADLRVIVASDAFKERTKNLGINAYTNTPAELSAWMTKEIARWKEVVAAAGIKPE